MPSGTARRTGPVTEAVETRQVAVRGRWVGYRPSLSPVLGNPGAFADMRNLIQRRGILTYDYGWVRYQDSAPVAAALPLGGIGSLFPGGTTGNPVMLLDWFPDPSGSGAQALVAVTADNGTRNGTLFYYPDGTPFNGPWTASVDLAATGIPTDETHVMDSCLYQTSYATGALANPRGTYFWTTGVRDTANCSLYFWPAAAVGNYAIAPTPGTFPDLSGGGNFSCRSLAATHERVYAFNTLEGTAANRRQPNRLRWTRPGWNTYVNTVWSSTTGLGAGYQDLTLCPGEGVCVREHGRNLTCYFEGGVVILAYTGQSRPHLSVQYVSHQRGLLGTRALIDIGGGVHFGAFTDGFWFLTSSGEWNEAGVENADGIRYRKFTDQFFATLSRANAYRIQMGFDSERRLVYITYPTSASGWSTWIYDIQLDEMYPMTATVSGLSTQRATSYAYAGHGIDNDNAIFVHGTGSGHVWAHDPQTSQRDGVAVDWSLTTHPLDYGDSFAIHSILYGWLDGDNHNVSSNAMAWQITEERLNTALLTVPKPYTGSNGQRGAYRFPFHVSGSGLVHTIGGDHPFSIYDIGHTVQRIGETP